MIYSEFGDSLLLRQFRDYYDEVIGLKQSVNDRQLSGDISVGDISLDIHESPARFAYQHLSTFLDQQQRAAIQLGSEYWNAYEEARYVMVVLADEIFLNLDWEGRFAWNYNLLEEELFQTRLAGVTFFQRIDDLLKNRDPIRVELAKIYLMALALGFQGRYRGGNSEDLLAYRHRLYTYIFQSGLHLKDDTVSLFPESLRNTLDSGHPVRMLPPVHKWIVRLVVAVVLALIFQQIIWRYIITDEIRSSVDYILETSPDQ